MNIHQALDAAKAEFPAIHKDSENPHFKSRFASLKAINEAVVPVLRAHGIVIQHSVDHGALTTEVRLTHSTPGNLLAVSSTLSLGEYTTPQAQGSAITYARRYNVVTLLDLTTEDDDDGNAASSAPAAPTRTRRARAPRSEQGQPIADTGNVTTTPESAPAEPQAEAGAPAQDSPAVPEGWESLEAATSAHNALAARIRSIPDGDGSETDIKAHVLAYRAEHGWPLSVTQLEEVEALVLLAEGFSA